MKGAYVLLAELKESRKIKVGRLGLISFRKGFYAYVGSALSGYSGRITRHLRCDKKKFWHIDFLLEKARVKKVYLFPSSEREECLIASILSKNLEVVPLFGSSDCGCAGHLFYAKTLRDLKDAIDKVNGK